MCRREKIYLSPHPPKKTSQNSKGSRKRGIHGTLRTHTHTLFSPLTVNLMPVSNVLLSVSLMKAECVGEHFHHAWVHAVNPPEQHTYTSTCTETHKRAHTMARGSGKCRNTIQDYTQGHTRVHFRAWTLCTWLQVSPSVSLSLSTFHFLPLTCKCTFFPIWFTHTEGSLSLAHCRHWAVMGPLSKQRRAHPACQFSLKDCNPRLSAWARWLHSHWPTLLWCSPGRWLQCPPGMTGGLPVGDNTSVSSSTLDDVTKLFCLTQ